MTLRDPYTDGFRLSRAGEPCRMEGGTEQRLRRDESIEPGRLRRAIALLPFVEQIGPRDFYVKGNDEPMYHVSLDTNPPCYCRDAEMRGMQCKHELCCRLRVFEPQVVKAMADIIESDTRNLAEYMKRRKKKGAA